MRLCGRQKEGLWRWARTQHTLWVTEQVDLYHAGMTGSCREACFVDIWETQWELASREGLLQWFLLPVTRREGRPTQCGLFWPC